MTGGNENLCKMNPDSKLRVEWYLTKLVSGLFWKKCLTIENNPTDFEKEAYSNGIKLKEPR